MFRHFGQPIASQQPEAMKKTLLVLALWSLPVGTTLNVAKGRSSPGPG